METPLTGGCGCGAVRFALDAPPVGAVYCHCTRCQRRTGSAASASARVAPGSVRVVAGEEHVRAWAPEGGNEKLFCALCGSAVFTRRPGGPIAAVRLGSFDADPGVRPAARQFTAYAAPWEPIPDDGLPRFAERAPG
jgi:hypothetical protein